MPVPKTPMLPVASRLRSMAAFARARAIAYALQCFGVRGRRLWQYAERSPGAGACPLPLCQPQPCLLPSPPATSLANAKSWGYQLQGIDAATIAASPYDLVVIDYSRDGTEGGVLTAAEIARMKVKPDGTQRLVICYLSIGEAESYRYYWAKRWSWMSWGGWRWFWRLFGERLQPGWLGSQNPEWKGNYAVRYWHPGWQDLIINAPGNYLERVMSLGFDGVYLDKIDQFVDMEGENKNSRGDMIAFVDRLAKKARALEAGLSDRAPERRGAAAQCRLPRHHRRHRQGRPALRRTQGQGPQRPRPDRAQHAVAPAADRRPQAGVRGRIPARSHIDRRGPARTRGQGLRVALSPTATWKHCASAISPQSSPSGGGAERAQQGLFLNTSQTSSRSPSGRTFASAPTPATAAPFAASDCRRR